MIHRLSYLHFFIITNGQNGFANICQKIGTFSQLVQPRQGWLRYEEDCDVCGKIIQIKAGCPHRSRLVVLIFPLR
jgi:hypothetical protein